MALIKMLADMMLYLLKAPYALMNYLNQLYVQRMLTSRALTSAQREAKEFSKVGKFFRFMGSLLLWALLAVVIVGTLVELWYLNGVLNLETRVLGGLYPYLRPFWLPLLLVLFCVYDIAGYQLFRSLGPDRDLVEFADLEEAWVEARAAARRGGNRPEQRPPFLVLGRPASSNIPCSMAMASAAARFRSAIAMKPIPYTAGMSGSGSRRSSLSLSGCAPATGRQAGGCCSGRSGRRKLPPTTVPAVAFGIRGSRGNW